MSVQIIIRIITGIKVRVGPVRKTGVIDMMEVMG